MQFILLIDEVLLLLLLLAMVVVRRIGMLPMLSVRSGRGVALGRVRLV